MYTNVPLFLSKSGCSFSAAAASAAGVGQCPFWKKQRQHVVKYKLAFQYLILLYHLTVTDWSPSLLSTAVLLLPPVILFLQ